MSNITIDDRADIMVIAARRYRDSSQRWWKERIDQELKPDNGGCFTMSRMFDILRRYKPVEHGLRELYAAIDVVDGKRDTMPCPLCQMDGEDEVFKGEPSDCDLCGGRRVLSLRGYLKYAQAVPGLPAPLSPPQGGTDT